MDVFKDIPFKGIFQTKAFNFDNVTFKLFYKVTSGMLLLASLLVFADQYFGDPIECDDKHGIKDKIFEMHCWMHGARKMPGLSDSAKDGDGHPVKLQEIFKCHMKVGTENDTTRFYQWVVFMLLIQAGAFRIPHIVWKFFEGGLMKAFYSDGNVKSAHNKGKNDKDKGLTSLVAEKAEFFINLIEPENYKSRNWYNIGDMQWYYISFLFCEILNLVVVAIMWVVTDVFLNGNFHEYGSDFYREMRYGYKEGSTKSDDTVGYNVMCNAFPTVADCRFSSIGSGGSPNKGSGICMLPQNIINQKIYLVIWFWFIILMTVGSFQILFEIVLLFVPSIRNRLITWKMGRYATPNVKRFLNLKCGIGNWFILYQIRKNTDKHFFCLFLGEIAGTFFPEIENTETSDDKQQKSQTLNNVNIELTNQFKEKI